MSQVLDPVAETAKRKAALEAMNAGHVLSAAHPAPVPPPVAPTPAPPPAPPKQQAPAPAPAKAPPPPVPDLAARLAAHQERRRLAEQEAARKEVDALLAAAELLPEAEEHLSVLLPVAGLSVQQAVTIRNAQQRVRDRRARVEAAAKAAAEAEKKLPKLRADLAALDKQRAPLAEAVSAGEALVTALTKARAALTEAEREAAQAGK